jgi:hypothetical protein
MNSQPTMGPRALRRVVVVGWDAETWLQFGATHMCVLPCRSPVNVEIGSANNRRADLNDCIARILNLRVGNSLEANVTFAVPAKCLHADASIRCEEN